MGIPSNAGGSLIRAGALLLALAVVAPGARAEEQPAKPRRSYTVDRYSSMRLTAAHEAIGASKYDEALKLMEEMKAKRGLNDHERALMWQTFGYIHMSKEQPQKAIDAFKQCVALDAMPDQALLSVRYNIGQLYLVTEQYPKAVETLEAWFKVAQNPSPQAHYMLAVALNQTKQFEKALEHAQAAINSTPNPQESWLQLKLASLFQLKRMREMIPLLEQMIARFPKKQYWLQLAAIYGELGDQERTLAVMELAHAQGYLTQASEVTNVVQLCLLHDLPVKAARYLEKGIADGLIPRDQKALELLSSCYLRGRDYDKALGPLGEAARRSEKGDLFVQLGQVHMEREEWKEAAGAFKAALEKPSVQDPANCHLLGGIALYNAKRPELAKKAFEQAKGFEKTRSAASQWLGVLREEELGEQQQ